MPKCKISEATGIVLDYFVAKCIFGDRYSEADLIQIAYRQRYSSEWAQGGPIIASSNMEFDYDEANQIFRAYDGVHAGEGKTHLLAAMRCFVANLGEEAEYHPSIY